MPLVTGVTVILGWVLARLGVRIDRVRIGLCAEGSVMFGFPSESLGVGGRGGGRAEHVREQMAQVGDVQLELFVSRKVFRYKRGKLWSTERRG